MNYIDLFAGAGGLTEGFVRSGFTSVAHLEMDEHACDTLKTIISYHYLKANKHLDIYNNYLQEKIGGLTIDAIFEKINDLKKNEKIGEVKSYAT